MTGSSIIGSLVGDRWRVSDLLGRGGFGQVFACRDESDIGLGDAAVKLLHAHTTPLERSEFLAEVKQMAQLRHQNLVGYLDSGLHIIDDEVHPFLVTELCRGSLTDHLTEPSITGEDTFRPLDGAAAAAVLADVLDGLIHLHERSLVHRDLKPANVLRGDGAWKLADFGLMRELTATGSYHRSDQIIGTPLYMAPELFTTSRTTSASDVYAIGVLAHVLMTGQAVHSGTGPALVQAITSTPPRLDPSLGPSWLGWITAALRPDPTQRPSARALRDGLKTLDRTVTVAGVPPRPGAPNPAVTPAPGAGPWSPPSPPGSDRYAGPTSYPDSNRYPGPASYPGQASHPGHTPSPAAVGASHGGQAMPPPATTGLRDRRPLPPPDDSSRGGRLLVPLLVIGGLLVVATVLLLAAGLFTLRSASFDDEGVVVAADEVPTTTGPTGDVEIGVNVEVGEDVIIGDADSDEEPTGTPEPLVSPAEDHVAVVPCSSGVTEQVLITNPDEGHRDYRIHLHHYDEAGVRVDERIALLKGLAPGAIASAGVAGSEDGIVSCQIAEFTVSATDPASIDAVQHADLTECSTDGTWHSVAFTVTNPTDQVVGAEVYVAVVDTDGMRIDEDWAGASVYEIAPGETVQDDASHVFWNLDDLGRPEVSCEIVAVEFD